MKNNTPLFLAITILIGLVTLAISTKYLFNAIEIAKPSHENILIIGTDTLSVSPILNDIPKFQNGGDALKAEVALANTDNKAKTFYLNIFPATLNWIVFHSVALSIGMASILFMLFLIWNLKTRFEIHFSLKQVLKVIVPLLMVLIIAVVFYRGMTNREVTHLVSGAEIMEHFNIIFSNPTKTVGNMVMAFFAIGLVPLIGIMMVNIAISKLFKLESDAKADFISKYNAIKDSLNIFALFTGLLVTITVVGTRLQRNMIAEQISGKAIENSIYPDEFIYAYGIAFTFLLALFFLPSLVYLKYLKSKKGLITKDNSQSLSWWKIGKESIDDLKLTFSIILPLIGSIVQSFL